MQGSWMRFIGWMLVAVPLAHAQEPAPPPAAQTPPTAAPPASTTPSTAPPPASTRPTPAGGTKDAPATDAPAGASRSAPRSPQRFVPSERVRADYPVAFPIDI